MIPREILKKIRLIEIRTNRLVSETIAGFSPQPSAELGGIPFAVPNGDDYHPCGFGADGELGQLRLAQHDPADRDFTILVLRLSGRSENLAPAGRTRRQPRLHPGRTEPNPEIDRTKPRTTLGSMA